MGGYLLRRSYFQKKTGNEYMEIFKTNNLISHNTVVEFCPIGYQLIMNNRRLKDEIITKYPNINVEDLYLKTQIIFLKKK